MKPDDPGAFHVDTVELDGRAELRLVGELDGNSAGRLAAALEPVYEQGVASLVLDLSLQFIDSSGLRHLVMGLTRQRDRGGEVVLHAPTAQTLRVLEAYGARYHHLKGGSGCRTPGHCDQVRPRTMVPENSVLGPKMPFQSITPTDLPRVAAESG